MKSSVIVRHTVAVAIGALFAGTAFAGLPSGVTVKTEHPRLYGTAADFNRLALEAAVGPKNFPSHKGEIRFTIIPKAKGDGDGENTRIFGEQHGPNGIYIRHADSVATAGTTWLQVVFQRTPAVGTTLPVNAFFAAFNVAADKSHDIVITWDAVAKTASVTVDNVLQPQKWLPAGDGWFVSQQKFLFGEHKGDVIKNFTVRNTETGEVWSSAKDQPIDVNLNRSWAAYLELAERTAATLNACDLTKSPAELTGFCNTTLGGRNSITEPAKWIALAYRNTGRPEFLTAAKNHIKLLLKADLGAGEKDGPEWSMSGRVGAMGIYYDWLYDALKDDTPDGVTPYHQAIASRIKATIRTDVANTGGDLITLACGYQTMTDTASVFDCASKPIYINWNGTGPSIANNYISGHSASANTGSVLGLLAIADANPEVKPLIDTIYDHFKLGYLRARDFYAVDGGNHTLFAYGSAGETADRLVMWKRALTNDPNGGLVMQSAAQMVYPYIYGVRGDGTYPARGDDFSFNAGGSGIGSMALVAAASGDGHAAAFYWNDVVRNRGDQRWSAGLFQDRLLYPKPTQAQPSTDLPLARLFKVAGNVLVRDTWTHADATLLEFKSSSFITENHHHLDQNSFSLNYKAPLLLDSGRYDNYGSNHWLNYYTRSIAHNTITVWDSSEAFGTRAGADGGQWFGTRKTYPTIEQIMPGGANALDGVTAFEDGGDFAYVLGNASKAYVNGKIDAAAGFLRSVVYLQPKARGERPKVLVFDSVRPSKAGLGITSLLHSVNKPASTILPTYDRDGRYKFAFAGAAEPLTIRNGGGMVTVQPLLPAQSDIAIVGGLNEGGQCVQAADPLVSPPKAESTSGDCRFMVRTRQNDQFVWRNFAMLDKPIEQTRETDIGAWRVEIAPRTAPAAGTAQYFLNVLHVDDSDGATGGAAAIEKASVLSTADNTVAVALADGRTFVFNGGPVPATVLKWSPGANPVAPTLVFGLVPNQDYAVTIDLAAASKFVLTQTVGGKYRSSANGVVQLNR